MAGTKRPADAFDSDSSSDSNSHNPPDDLDSSLPPRIITRHRHRLYTASRRITAEETRTAETKTPKRDFNIFKSILRHPHLFFEFTLRLPPKTLEDLYAIDKEFHYRFNKYSLSVVHDWIKYHCADAASVFSWSLYKELCISDPSLKPMDARLHLARDVPSLRWTKLVLYRDGVVREILTSLAMEGHRVPRATAKTVMKYWTLMEINKQAKREAFVSSAAIWTDADIILFHLFLIKLDMRFSHPIQGQGINALSHLLLTQKSLLPLRDILNGNKTLDYEELGEMVIRTYPQDALDLDAHPWMDDMIENGVDEWEWGIYTKEGWDDEGAPLTSGMDLLTLEGIKRGLHIHRWYMDFVLYGFVDEKTGRNVPIPRKWRGDGDIVMPEQGWPSKEESEKQVKKWDARFL